MPRDVTITFNDGTVGQYKNVPDAVQPDEVMARVQADPAFQGKTIKELDGGNRTPFAEIGRVVDKSVRGGLTGLPGILGDAVLAALRDPNATKTMGVLGLPLRALQAIPGMRDQLDQTKFGDVTNAIQTAGGVLPKLSEPQTSGGKAVANVAEPVVSTMAGGGAGTMGQKAAIGLGSGLGGEGAARLFGDNVLTRLLGSAVGGGAVGVAQAIKPNADVMMRQATEQMTDADWAKARVLEATLNREGIPHLKSQLLGDRSTMADTVAVAGTNPTVRPKLVTKVADSSAKAQDAFGIWQDANLPVPGAQRREVLGDVQQVAADEIKRLRNKANVEYRANMPPEGLQYPQDSVESLRQSLVDLAKSSKYGETTDAGKAILTLSKDLVKGEKLDLSGVNPTILLRARQAGEDLSALPGAKMTGELVTDAHQINNLIKELNLKSTLDNYKGLPTEEVKNMFKAFTPEFDAARAAKTAVMTDEVNPALKGLAGDIANMGGGVKLNKFTAKDTAIDMVFPKDKLQTDQILKLKDTIGGDGVGLLLREHMAKAMETATMKGPADATLGQPAAFSRAITGTKAQRANVDAALHVVAVDNGVNPAAVRLGFKKLIDAFDSFSNLKLPSQVDRSSLAQEAGKNLPGLMVAPNSRLGRLFSEKMMAKTYDRIAEVVLSKDGLQKLEALAKSPKQALAQQLAVSIVTEAQAGEPKTDE